MRFLNLFKKYFLPFFPYITVFIAALYIPFDADLGWHLKYGEYFFKHGTILRENTFSSMMPDYHWANHSWLSDLLTYFAYINFGFLGLSILAALIIALTFYFFSKAFNFSIWHKTLIFPLLIYFLIPVNSISFRSQLISYLFTGILILILSRYRNNSKIIYYSIPLFILWVNFHGGFILGLIIFAIWTASFIFELINFDVRKLRSIDMSAIKNLIFAFVLSSASTLVNPFGISIYREIIDRVDNPWRIYIMEWSPFSDLSSSWWNQVVIFCYILFGAIFFFAKGSFRKNFSIFVVASVLFILSFFERRYAWTAYYLIAFFIKPIAYFFKPVTEKYTVIGSLLVNIIVIAFVFFWKMPFSDLTNMSWNKYCQLNYCSDSAIEFLMNKNNKENLFTPYNWGGYMIWKYPKVKPLIDGRMHLWKDETGYSAFGEYYPLEQNWKDIDKSKYNLVLIQNNKPLYKRLIKLVSLGRWKMIYKDKYSGIFIKG